MSVVAERFAYIGIEPCGCVSAATVDSPDRKRDVAKFVAELLRDGCTVERVSVKDARTRLALCPHNPKWGRGEPTLIPAQETLL